MLILVTRPEPQATQWARQLEALGVRAQALPLIDIGPPADAGPVEALWARLDTIDLLMFVSPNAAQWFARLRPADATWPGATWAAAPGPGTAEVVRDCFTAAGLHPDRLLMPPPDAEQFDSEHLWPVLAAHDWRGRHVRIVSGGDRNEARGRQWLTQRLTEAGADVSAVLTYRRQAARWTADQRALQAQAWAHPAEHLWLLSSSEAVDHLRELAGPVPQGAHALATHPRVAEHALAAGFTEVTTVAPRVEAVAQARRLAPPSLR